MVSSTTGQLKADGGDSAGVDQGQSIKTSSVTAKRPREAQEDTQVSQALRTVYQRAVDEDIPSEMLDLLNKLG